MRESQSELVNLKKSPKNIVEDLFMVAWCQRSKSKMLISEADLGLLQLDPPLDIRYNRKQFMLF